MQISKNSAVEFHYTLSEAGEQLETSTGSEPLTYIHGLEGMLPGLETALEGKAAGDSFSVTLTPSESYGERVDDLIQRIPLKHLQGDTKVWKPGMTAMVSSCLLYTDEAADHLLFVTPGGLRLMKTQTYIS